MTAPSSTVDRDLQTLLNQKASYQNDRDDSLLLEVVLKTVDEAALAEDGTAAVSSTSSAAAPAAAAVPEQKNTVTVTASVQRTNGDGAGVPEDKLPATSTTASSSSTASSSTTTAAGASSAVDPAVVEKDDADAPVETGTGQGSATATKVLDDAAVQVPDEAASAAAAAEAAALIGAHDLSIFRVHCRCVECLKYRETVIQLFLEDFEYNTLWKRLQLLVRRFYDLVPDNADLNASTSGGGQPQRSASSTSAATTSASGAAATSTATTAGGVKWVGDGRQLDTKKNIQLSLSSNLPLTNDMTFILVFSMLYRRDPHQLFELLCMQLRSIATMYSNTFKSMLRRGEGVGGAAGTTTATTAATSTADAATTTTPKTASQASPTANAMIHCDPEELINFVLDGYDKMCNAARIMSPLLFELQRGHMQKFALTWNLLNKRIYQRWVYWSVKDLIPVCILKLRTTLDPYKYRCMVYRFIKFDDEMTLITYKWRDIWTSLNIYHLGAEDRRRRERIRTVHAMLKSIKQTQFAVAGSAARFDDARLHTAAWLNGPDRDQAWAYTVHYLRTRWTECRDPRLLAGLTGIQCLKCDRSPATHYVDCICRSCILAGGPSTSRIKDPNKEFFCTKCTKFEKIDREYLRSVTQFADPNDEDQAAASAAAVAAVTSSGGGCDKENCVQPSRNVAAASLTATKQKTAAVKPPVWEEWSRNHSYHLAWAVFLHLPNRRPYVAPRLDVRHFCTFQSPPCPRNDCRVATQIIAGLYPMNFSKFLITTYEPVHDDDSKGMMHFHLAFLLRKLCSENGQANIAGGTAGTSGACGSSAGPSAIGGGSHISLADLLTEVDDTDNAMLCKIGSAFTECYLTENALPVSELLHECFIYRQGVDVELNVAWLEAMYADQDEEVESAEALTAPPLKCTLHQHEHAQLMKQERQIQMSRKQCCYSEADPKLRELRQIGPKMDQFFSVKTSVKSAAGGGGAKRHSKLSQMLGDDCCEGGGGDGIRVTGSGGGAGGLEMLVNPFLAAAACQSEGGGGGADMSTTTIITAEKIECTAALSGVVAAVAGGSATANGGKAGGDHLAEAIKLAVNQKLNLQLEEELRTLKEEHSVLKDMVRDLEQMKENEEKQIKSGGCPLDVVDERAMSAMAKAAVLNNAPGVAAKMAASGASGGGVPVQATASGSASGSGGGHPCCADHADLLPDHPNKMCHRYDGQCNCYYCTIFGHTECNHGRTNETRDRLRKRLQTKDTMHPSWVKSTRRRSKSTKATSPTSAAAPPIVPAADKPVVAPSPTPAKSAATAPNPATAKPASNIDLATMLAAIDADIAATQPPLHGRKPPPAVAAHLAAIPSSATTISTDTGGVSSTKITTVNGHQVSVTTKSSTTTYTHQRNLTTSEQHTTITMKQLDPVAAVPQVVAASAAAAAGVKRKMQPPVVQRTQNVVVNGSAVAPPSASQSAKKEAGICSLRDDHYRIKKLLTKKAALVKAQQCAAKLTVPAAAATCTVGAAPQQQASNASAPTAATRATAHSQSGCCSANHASTSFAHNAATSSSSNSNHCTAPHHVPPPTNVQFPPPPPIEVEEEDVSESFIERLVEYIEGGGGGSAARRDLQKKAAKKAKQKQKKQVDKKVEELEALRSEFHDVFYRESEAKQELKLLKAAGKKTKDKKRLTDADNLVKKLGKQRGKHEAVILELIAELKATNAEFKFAYLPSKEQLLEMQQATKNGEAEAAQCTTPKRRPATPSVPRISGDGASAVVPGEGGEGGEDCDSERTPADPSKRMVTIRRVNVPHADPQVTVTAKGPSPDKDKLLYTFVNGQLVAEPCRRAASDAMPVNLADVYHKQHEELRQMNIKRHLDARVFASGATSNGTGGGAGDVFDAPNVSVKTTAPTTSAKTADADAAASKPKAATAALPKPVLLTGKAKKKAEKKARKAESSAKAAAYREQQLATRQGSIDETSSIDTTSTASKVGKPAAGKAAQAAKAAKTSEADVERLTAQTKKLRLREEAATAKAAKEKEQKRRVKVKHTQLEYADPQYRNNKFDVLDMDDDDDDEYEVSDSESERSYESSVATPPPPPPPSKSSKAASALRKVLPVSPIEYQREIAFTTVRGSKADKAKAKNTPAKSVAEPGPVSTPSAPPAVRPQATATVVPPPSMLQSYMRPPLQPQPLEIQLSKKQKKKLAQQQARLVVGQPQTAPATAVVVPPPATASVIHTSNPSSATTTSSFVKPAETMAQTLKNSMQRLSLNDDTTIELVREHAAATRLQQQLAAAQLQNPSVSIIDQLQRGVQMEGLMLPPGITLTRVDPEHAEMLRAKKESIQNLSQPMQPCGGIETMPAPPHVLMPTGHLGGRGGTAAAVVVGGANPANSAAAAGGIIMVDTAKLHRDAHPTLADATAKKGKKNRRRTKNKRDGEGNGQAGSLQQQQQSQRTGPDPGARLVTLRNPMFQPPGGAGAGGVGMMLQPPPSISQPLTIDSPASITKNANGMFTIRNPAMHQALHQTMPANLMKQPPPPIPQAVQPAVDFQPLPAYLQPPPMLPPMCVPPPNMLGAPFHGGQQPTLPAVVQPQLHQPPPVAPQTHTTPSKHAMPPQESFSFFSDHNIIAPQPPVTSQHQQQHHHSMHSSATASGVDTANNGPVTPPRSHSAATPAIGSEVKNALQRKQQQLAWQQQHSSNGSTANGGSASADLFSHFNSTQPSTVFGRSSPSAFGHFNSDFMGGNPSPTPSSVGASQSQPPPGISGPVPGASRYFNTDANGTTPTSSSATGIYGGGAIGTFGSDSGPFDSGSIFGATNGTMSSSSSTSAHQMQRHSPPVAVGQTVGSYFNRPTLSQQLAAQQQQQQQHQSHQSQQPPMVSEYVKNFEFLNNLQPGQRLNSEVTIHNVNESKFHRGNDAAHAGGHGVGGAGSGAGGLANNGVEITRVPPPSMSHLQQQQQQHQQSPQHHHNTRGGGSLFGQQFNDGMAVPTSEQSSRFHMGGSGASAFGMNNHNHVGARGGHYMGSEFADNGLFAPNQQVSLNDLESEERDIESFKRFNYYFKPPTNKPKVNFDVKNFMMANRKSMTTTPGSSDSSSSPYYSETGSLNGGTPSLDDLLYNDLSLLQLGAAQLNGGVSVEELGMLAGGNASLGGAGVIGGVGGAGLGAIGGVHGGAHGGASMSGAASNSGSVGSRADSFIHGLLDGNELKSGLVD